MTSTQPHSDSSDSQPGQSMSRQEKERRAWAPLVLSLDGGGVRGLSSLYIIRAIMQRIKDIDENEPESKLETRSGLPLPCNYFDFIIGTSTGGLIAVMLGRLRMDVEDCIQQYWIMSIKIFRPYHIRVIRMYSRRVLQESAKDVVKAFCGCHDENQVPCRHEELRQHDFEEAYEQGPSDRLNKTCKVAVLTVREKGITDFQIGRGDTNILFRSYNHRPRLPHTDGEFNPKTLHHSKLAIHEACSVTTAAPTYFHSVRLRGRKYIDGGVWANNPAMVAWNEAVYMGESLDGNDEKSVKPKMLLSVGTGARSEPSRFGFSIVGYGFRKITGTSDAESAAREAVRTTPGSQYFRLDVPETHELSKIGLAECKKKRIRRPFRRQSVGTTAQNGNSNQTSSTDRTKSITGNNQHISIALERDRELRRLAAISNTDFDPQRFDYKTFDRIRDQTIQYIHHMERDQIERCARLLWEASWRRKDLTEDRWTAFRTHPNPSFPRQAEA